MTWTSSGIQLPLHLSWSTTNIYRPEFTSLRRERKKSSPLILLCNDITHDGSMSCMLYMVCHGSHQYTPFMLAYIAAPWIGHGLANASEPVLTATWKTRKGSGCCCFFRNDHESMGIFPYIGLIYGRYLQFRFLKWPLNEGTFLKWLGGI